MTYRSRELPRQRTLFRHRLPLALLASTSLLCFAALPAQAQEVVQPLPDPAAGDLNAALQRLARDPQSVAALVEAGQASLMLNDVDAALGFYNRAQAVAPADGAVLAGLAQIAVKKGDGAGAVQLFDGAQAAGFALAPLAGERGLAYDLTAQNALAQQQYLVALAAQNDPEITLRLALSYAIAGDAAASEATLLPLMQRQDRAAYRARAFALAIGGQQEQAVTIAETMLPERLALRLEPYLRYMPRLTPSQQAAAVNLGRFPAASQMGRDEDPRLAALEQSGPPRRGGPDDRLIPGGQPLVQAVAPPAPPPAPAPVVVAQIEEPLPAASGSGELPALAAANAEPIPASPVTGDLPSFAAASPPLVTPSGRPSFAWARMPDQAQAASPAAPLAEPEAPAPQPEEPAALAAELPPAPFAQPAEAPITVLALEQPAPQPAFQPAPPPQPEPEIDLAEAFAEFGGGAASRPLAPSAGAVDITRIEITRERPPPPPPIPSRQWVQVATGQDTAAFRFDWRRIKREAGGLLDTREAFQARWGESNRLLTGPFPNAAAANAFVAQLTEKGVDAFRFTSATGEEVRPLQ